MSLENLEIELKKHLIDYFNQLMKRVYMTKKYPAVINRHQAKEILQVGDTKFSEIINREDFQFVKVKYTQGKFSYSNLLKWINSD